MNISQTHHVNRTTWQLTEKEVVLRDLSIADLLVQRVGSEVHIRVDAQRRQLIRDLLRVAIDDTRNRDDQHLPWAQPKRPLPRKMLRNNSDKAIQTPKDRAVDHNGASGWCIGVVGVVVWGAVLEVEALGELEVELVGRALEGALEGVADGDVDLWAVEGAVAGVELPL